jgi:hypothetical protein
MAMRRIFVILTVFVFCFSLTGNSQVIQGSKNFRSEIGFNAGLNFQQMVGQPWTPQYNPGILIGAFKEFQHQKRSWRVELNFTQAHYTTVHTAAYQPWETYHPGTPDTVQKGDFNLFYLRLPVISEYKIYKSLKFLIGLEYSQQLSIIDNNGAFTKDFKKSGGLNSIFNTASLMGCTGIQLKAKDRISFNLRYSLGLTDQNKGAKGTNNNFRTYDSWKIWSLQTTLGFRLSSKA